MGAGQVPGAQEKSWQLIDQLFPFHVAVSTQSATSVAPAPQPHWVPNGPGSVVQLPPGNTH